MKHHGYALVLTGPGLGLGCLALLVARTLLSKVLFLGAFWSAVGLTVLWLASRFLRLERRTLIANPVFLNSFAASCLVFVILSGLQLQVRWTWTFQVVLVATLVIFSLRYQRLVGSRMAMLAGFIALAMSATPFLLPTTWWLGMEGIPNDEAVLEAMSNGLVEFGPRVSVLYESLSASQALAYHHLALLLAGVISTIAELQSYEALLIALPILIANCCVSSLFILCRLWRKTSCESVGSSLLSHIGIAITLWTIDIGGSPTSWFGISSVFAHIAIAGLCITEQSPIIALVVFAIMMRWRFLPLTILPFFGLILLAYFFYVNSFADDSLLISYLEFADDDLWYQFKVFVQTYLLPNALGLGACLLLLTREPREYANWTLVFGLLVIFGMASQFFLSSSYADGHGYFKSVATIGVGLLMLQLAFVLGDSHHFKGLHLAAAGGLFVVVLATAHLRFADRELIKTPILALLSAVILAVLWMVRHRFPTTRGAVWYLSTWLIISTFLILVAFTQALQVATKTEDWVALSITRELSDWYGEPELDQIVKFITRETTANDLLAVSLCPGDHPQSCQPDFRLAALTNRRFLTSEANFSRSQVPPIIWRDYELLRSLRSREPSFVVRDLRERSVDYLITDDSFVGIRWEAYSQLVTSNVQYRNSRYTIYKLSK
ncbi:MAG: hypothetical protein EBY88_03245 [Actinobacteria bacterium]|nr:hypothetical protein [Actinomycetota bacterium]